MRHFVHLHGFLSSPSGTKASYLRRRFSERGHDLITPDLNQPSFFDMTITRQIEAVRSTVSELHGPVTLMGSSMGALVAMHYTVQHGGVERLVLMAPALDLAYGMHLQLGEERLEQWRQNGRFEFYHFTAERMEPLSFALYEDLSRYPTDALSLEVPTLIIQGTRDELCQPERAIRFAKRQKQARLVMLDTDHPMTDQVERIFEEICSFLEL